jgi:hypothetical protein
MNIRENVLAVLNGKKPDWVPWLGDLDYWYKALLRDSILPLNYRGEGIFQLHQDLGVGYYLQGYHPFQPVYDGVNAVETEDENWRIIEVTTPIGNLRSVRKYLRDSYSWGFIDHLINDWRDLEILRYLYEHTSYIPDYQLAEERYELIGENGVVVVYPPRTPFMQLVAMDAGIETVVDCTLYAPEEFDHTMYVMEQKYDQATEIVLASPAEIIEFPENLSSEVVGKRFFNKYLKALYMRWNQKIKDAGKYSSIHFDGTLRGLIREVSQTGFSFLEAVTPAPVGDISFDEMAEWVNEETVLWGGIPGGYFSDIQMNDADFEKYVISILEIIKSRPTRYILGVSDQVVPGSRWERIKRVGQLVEQHGKIV